MAGVDAGALPDADGAEQERMRKLKIIEHISLDGVIQVSGDDGDLPYGDWTAPERLVRPHRRWAAGLLGARGSSGGGLTSACSCGAGRV